MKLKLLLSTVGLALGCGAVGLSLMMASQVSSHESTRLTARELYWGEDILPDHLFYPVLMALDKVQLEQANEVEQVYIRVVYAGRRLVYAQELVKKGRPELAVATLTKSQKYLLEAAYSVQAMEQTNSELIGYLLKASAFHQREIAELRPQLPETSLDVVSQLEHESEIVMQRLAERLQK